MKKKIYLACPYSSKDKEVMEGRVKYADKIAGLLMQRGFVVFSPISHSHPIAETMDAVDNCDHNFWLEQDLSFLTDWADELWVVKLDGWEKSKGIKLEIEIAESIPIAIRYLGIFDFPIDGAASLNYQEHLCLCKGVDIGKGLKGVAKQCGGLVVTDGKTTVKYDVDGKQIGPFGCRCKTLREKMVGDGCEICNPELAKWYAEEALKEDD